MTHVKSGQNGTSRKKGAFQVKRSDSYTGYRGRMGRHRQGSQKEPYCWQISVGRRLLLPRQLFVFQSVCACQTRHQIYSVLAFHFTLKRTKPLDC